MDPVATPPPFELPGQPRKRSYLLRALVAVVVLILILAAAAVAAYKILPSFRAMVDQALTPDTVHADLTLLTYQSYMNGRNASFKLKGNSLATSTPSTKPRASEFAPDGTQVYDLPVTSSTTSGIQRSVDPSQWTVFTKGSGTSSFAKRIATGYAPAFLDNTHIAYFAPDGFTILDLSTGRDIVLSTSTVSATLAPRIEYSPDATHVLWTDTASKTSVIAAIATSSYHVLHTYTALDLPALTNAAIYQAYPSDTGTEIWRFSFDGKDVKKVLTLPASPHIIAVTLP